MPIEAHFKVTSVCARKEATSVFMARNASFPSPRTKKMRRKGSDLVFGI